MDVTHLFREPPKELARVRTVDISKFVIRQAQGAEPSDCGRDGRRRVEWKVRPKHDLLGRHELQERADRGRIDGSRGVVIERLQVVAPTRLADGRADSGDATGEERYRAARVREDEPNIGPPCKSVTGQKTDDR